MNDNSIGTTASILKGTARVVSSSHDTWASIRTGSFFRFKGDDISYYVGGKKELFYVKEFKKRSDIKISISDLSPIDLTVGDEIFITFKESAVLTVTKVEDNSSGYRIGNTLFLEGGTPVVDLTTNLPERASFQVSMVDVSGKILQLELVNAGRYLDLPPATTKLIGGEGKNAIVDVEYRLLEARGTLDRTISKIEYLQSETVFTLNFKLPAAITEGKISCSKWEIYFTAPYAGNNKIAIEYTIARDHTPNLGLPLLVNKNVDAHIVYNETIKWLDNYLYQIKQDIEKIKKHINLK